MVRVIEQPYAPQHLINYARYTEAVTLFKTANDPVWYASALEGLAIVALLEALSGQGFVRSTVTS
jgi:trafficking protein particle complex subunit 9